MVKPVTGERRPLPRKVFIVEDHPVFRQGLIHMLNNEPGLSVCGHAVDAGTALSAICRLKPDVVLVDITLPGKSGLELIRKIRKVDRKVKLLVVSMRDEALYANRALRAGGDGYIMKREASKNIVNAVRDVLAGRIYVSEAVMGAARKLPQQCNGKRKTCRLDFLSDAELETLELVGRGKSRQEIARELGIRVNTVSSRCSQIRKKLNIDDLQESRRLEMA